MWNLKYNTNGLIYKIETDSQMWRTDRVDGVPEMPLPLALLTNTAPLPRGWRMELTGMRGVRGGLPQTMPIKVCPCRYGLR